MPLILGKTLIPVWTCGSPEVHSTEISFPRATSKAVSDLTTWSNAMRGCIAEPKSSHVENGARRDRIFSGAI